MANSDCNVETLKVSAPPNQTEERSPLAAFFYGLRHQPKLRRTVFVCWLLLWVGVLMVGVELLSRRYLVPWHHEIGNRHLQPYFMSGGYFQSSMSRFQDKEVFFGAGGPASFGYKQVGNIHLYDFEQELTSISERGNFLFQDRVEMANDVSSQDTIRVFALGGSAAYGIGATSIEKRWYVILEQLLTAKLGKKVQVIPSAMIGYVSTQERIVLELMVMPRRPDVVIVLDGFNDAVLPSIFGTRPGDPYDQGIFYQEFYSPLSGFKRWAANYSYFYRYLLYRSVGKAIHNHQTHIISNPNLLRNYGRSTASIYLDNVVQMLETCKGKNLPCLVFLQPTRDLTKRNNGESADLDPFTLTSYDEIVQRINSAAERYQIKDLTKVFDRPGAGRDYYLDNVHYRNLGHQAIAEAMAPVVLEAIRKTPKLAKSD